MPPRLPFRRGADCDPGFVRRRLPVFQSLLFATLLSGTVLLAGCEGDDDGAPAAASSSDPRAEGAAATATSTPTSTPTSGAAADEGGGTAIPADVSPDTAEPSEDAWLTVSDIRIGRHEGFDRVVFQVDGAGTPGWNVGYMDRATSQGSGEPLDVAGDVVI